MHTPTQLSAAVARSVCLSHGLPATACAWSGRRCNGVAGSGEVYVVSLQGELHWVYNPFGNVTTISFHPGGPHGAVTGERGTIHLISLMLV